jgi:predicted HAD superfamily phosphohydrolase YqeG
MKEVYFSDLDVSSIKDSLVIIDIDGTVTYDSGNKIDEAALFKIAELKAYNILYFCSNTPQPERIKVLAEAAGILYIETTYKKPNRRILEHIKDHVHMPIVVIGDKYLTDGRFANNVKATFIKVRRIIGSTEGLNVRIAYWIDDLMYRIVSIF